MSPPFRFDLAFGPGGTFCCDFYDPRRELSVKQPDDLQKILQCWYDERNPVPSTVPSRNTVPSDHSEATPCSEESDPEPKKASLGQEGLNPELSTLEDGANIGKKRTLTQQDDAPSNTRPGYPKIHGLAFGSRPNESAVTFRVGKDWFIGKPGFCFPQNLSDQKIFRWSRL